MDKSKMKDHKKELIKHGIVADKAEAVITAEFLKDV